MVITTENTKIIDISVKTLSKKYKYILGWQINDDNYDFVLFIDLIVDIKKLMDFYNVENKEPKISDYLRETGVSCPTMLFVDTSLYLTNKQEWENELTKCMNEKEEMNKTLNNIYRIFPEDQLIKTMTESIASISIQHLVFT